MDARDPSTPVKRKDVRKREREREWRRGGEVEASALAALKRQQPEGDRDASGRKEGTHSILQSVSDDVGHDRIADWADERERRMGRSAR